MPHYTYTSVGWVTIEKMGHLSPRVDIPERRGGVLHVT
jgi:hypothetical protein